MSLLTTWRRTRAQQRAARSQRQPGQLKSALVTSLMIVVSEALILGVGFGLPAVFLKDLELTSWTIWLAILYIGFICVLCVWVPIAIAARAKGTLPRGSTRSKSPISKMATALSAYMSNPPTRPSQKPLFPMLRRQGWRRVRGGALPVRGIPFTLGGAHKIVDVAEGTVRGRTARVLYYAIYGEETAAAPMLTYTVVAVFTDGQAPPTAVVPRRLTELAGLGIDAPGVKVESAAFNRKWRIESTDARAAHALMQPVMISRLLEKDAGESVVTWDRNVVMTVRDGYSDDLTSLDSDLELLVDLADAMPAYQTRSGAVGPRVREGDMAVAGPPHVTSDRVEDVLLVTFLIAYFFACILWLSRALTTVMLILLGIAACATAVYSIYAWLRRGRIRRAWLASVEARSGEATSSEA